MTAYQRDPWGRLRPASDYKTRPLLGVVGFFALLVAGAIGYRCAR